MTPFEYITVLISIILGMGITQLVTGVADAIHQWGKTKLYWPHLVWVGFVFFLHLQDWWETYALQTYASWRLSTFMFVVLYPINLFILARLLFPLATTGGVDFKTFYFSNYRKFFLWIIILSMVALINNLVISNYTWMDQIAPFSIIIILGTIAWRNIKNEFVHQATAVILWIALITVLVLKDFQIGQ